MYNQIQSDIDTAICTTFHAPFPSGYVEFPTSQLGSQASIEISYKIEAFRHAYLIHCAKLFHSQVGYFDSLILQALELLSGKRSLNWLLVFGLVSIPHFLGKLDLFVS